MLKTCLIIGTMQWVLGVDSFTLAWTHSIEKVRWEEDYRREGAILRITAARIRGSGAGMEPPPDAVLRAGVWHYRPALDRVPRLVLANSAFGGRYEICTDGQCRELEPDPKGGREPTIIAPCLADDWL